MSNDSSISKFLAVNTISVGHYLSAGAQLDDVVENQLVRLQLDNLAVAHDVGAWRVDDPELVEDLLGTQFLHHTDHAVGNDDSGEQRILRRAGQDHQRRQDRHDEVDRRQHVAANDLTHGTCRSVGHEVGLALRDSVGHFGGGESGGGIGLGLGHAVKLTGAGSLAVRASVFGVAITDEKYVLLTTFRKNGDAVATPVWIVGMPDGTGGFTTEATSGKVKRIRNNPSVTLQPCGMRGSVQPGSTAVNATAEVLLDADAQPIKAAVRRKYRIVTILLMLSDLIRKLFRRAEAPECAIRLRFD